MRLSLLLLEPLENYNLCFICVLVVLVPFKGYNLYVFAHTARRIMVCYLLSLSSCDWKTMVYHSIVYLVFLLIRFDPFCLLFVQPPSKFFCISILPFDVIEMLKIYLSSSWRHRKYRAGLHLIVVLAPFKGNHLFFLCQLFFCVEG